MDNNDNHNFSYSIVDVRLVVGSFDDPVITTPLGYGRVEVNTSKGWYAICDDGFDIVSSKLFCSHLNYRGGEVSTRFR